jgi:signal transduction histidine kinase
MSSDEPKVLVVDDEKKYLGDFVTLFTKKFNVLTACGGEEALAVLAKEPVGVVVSDQRMPKMTGSQLLAEVSKKYPQTVRILLTGYSDIDAVIEAVNRGEIYRYVPKDQSLKEIEVVIRQAVDKFKLEEANRQLLLAKKRLLKSLAVQQNLSTVGTLGQQLHQKIETLVMNLFNYVFQMRKDRDEKEFLSQFHKLQGALSKLRELSSFSEKLKIQSVGVQREGVNLILQEAATRAKAAAEKQGGCEVVLDLAEGLPQFPMQRYSFMRVMKELLENAILFGPKEGKKVWVRSRFVEGSKEGGMDVEPAVRIEVEDNGGGIPTAEVAKIFAPFYSSLTVPDPPAGVLPPAGDDYNLSQYYHYGFGLPIAQWIVCLRHNGLIDFNASPGKGTTAVVTIPIAHS